MQYNRYKLPLVALIVLVLVSIACSLFTRSEPEPVEPIPVTTEAVEDLKEDIQSAAEEARNSGRISLTISESELTSLIALELASVENAPVQAPQIALRDGQILFSGIVNQSGFSAPLTVSVAVQASGTGQVQYEILSAQVGPLPLSGTMLDQLSNQLDLVFTSYIRNRLGDVYIENINISNGSMTIEGHTK